MNLPTRIVMNALDGDEEGLRVLAHKYNLKNECDIKGGLISLVLGILDDEEFDDLEHEILDCFFQHVDFDTVIATFWRKEQ